MIKLKRKILLRVVYGFLAFAFVGGPSTALENEFFEKKDDDFWVLKNKEAFTQAADQLIDEGGNWKGSPPVPDYIKFCEPLTVDDLPVLEKWLSLKGLRCFGISDGDNQPNLNLILEWYTDLEDQGVNLRERNLYKLAWLNAKDTFHELWRGAASILPEEWVEINRAYQMKECHYVPLHLLVRSH